MSLVSHQTTASTNHNLFSMKPWNSNQNNQVSLYTMAHWQTSAPFYNNAAHCFYKVSLPIRDLDAVFISVEFIQNCGQDLAKSRDSWGVDQPAVCDRWNCLLRSAAKIQNVLEVPERNLERHATTRARLRWAVGLSTGTSTIVAGDWKTEKS